MKQLKFIYNPKITSILIIGICLTGILLGNYIQIFRVSNYRWAYQYGNYLNFVMVLSSVGWSFFHPLIILSDRKSQNKTKWKEQFIWSLVGFIPFLYFLIGIIISSI